MIQALNQSISLLPRTAPRTFHIFHKLGITTFFELLNYFPLRHEDYSTIIRITDLDNIIYAQQKVTIKAIVRTCENIYTRRRFTIQKAKVYDSSGEIEVAWFNQPYLREILKPGTIVSLAGGIKSFKGTLSFQAEEFEILKGLSDETVHSGRIVPIYPQTRGLSTKTIREKIYYVLFMYGDDIQDILPVPLLKNLKMIEEQKAYAQIHFPSNKNGLEAARNRLSFDELFIIQLSSTLIRQEWKTDVIGNAFKLKPYEKLLKTFEKSLPFSLTKAQKRCVSEIINDLSSSTPMNRLLQGDVGSGKTVVSAFGAFLAFLNGYKTLFMAPTEILAQQHYASVQKVFENLKKNLRPHTVLITSNKKVSKNELDKASIIIGTHALISGKNSFDNIGYVVVDEQHKFGVIQRAKLKEQGINPHLLSMTATPIPRTAMLTLYGELDVSIIDELPQGRLKIKTYCVLPSKRQDAYNWITKEVKHNKAQVFIVCPLIEESSSESMQNVKAVKAEFERLSKEIFIDLKLGLLHGRMKSNEKDTVISDFAKGKIDILVSTPVVEVGIDIPNATIMMIEAAQRFGMAQLHQLRGRVGRSDKQSYCLLFTEQNAENIRTRLEMFSKVYDGFKLAEYDLKHRGAGNIFGTQQHGIDRLNIASLSDTQLIRQAQKTVKTFLESSYALKDFPFLEERIMKYKIDHISRD